MKKEVSTTELQAQIALLQAQVASLSRDNELLAKENARIVADAQAAAEKAKLRIESLESKITRLLEQYKLANMRYFGSRSEKVIPSQLSLFNDMEAAANPTSVEPVLENAAGMRLRRRGGPRRIDTSKLERIVIKHELSAQDAVCPQCGDELTQMKIEVTEVVRLVPAHLVVEEHRRQVYRCMSCCVANAKDGEHPASIVRAPMKALTPIPGSFATASLVAGVLNAKYANSMPLYRIEHNFESLGAHISRQTMANWVLNVYERWLSLVHARMKEKLLEQRIIHADETEVQVLKEPNREAKSKSRMWLFRSAPRHVPNCIFEYHPTRSGQVARTFLKDWSGYLVTDGYAPYFNLGNPGVTNVACLVHIRRKFAQIVKAAGGDAKAAPVESVALEARRRIDKIFREDGKFDGLETHARANARQKTLKPLLEEFFVWAQQCRAAPGALRCSCVCA